MRASVQVPCVTVSLARRSLPHGWLVGPRGLGLSGSILIMAMLAAPRAAVAEPHPPASADELARAATLAASMGEYGFAIRAFEETYDATHAPLALFSIAEAYRQRYGLEKRPLDLEQAVTFYRRYRDADPNGSRAADAERTLSKLASELASVAVDANARDEARRAEADARRLAIASPVASAVARIDRGKPRPLPVFLEIAAGKHQVEVSAPGYTSVTTSVEVARGGVDAEDVPLDPKPARLDVPEPKGADVLVDGVAVGIVPFASPVDLDPGPHAVTVSLNGYHPHRERVKLVRGKTETLKIDLQPTKQRNVAWALAGTGTASLGAGIVLGVLAVVRDRAASSIANRPNQTLSATDQRRYDDDIAARNRFRVGAGVAGGVGLGLAVVGGFLFAFDSPEPPEKQKANRPLATRIRIEPLVDPGFAGASAAVQF